MGGPYVAIRGGISTTSANAYLFRYRLRCAVEDIVCQRAIIAEGLNAGREVLITGQDHLGLIPGLVRVRSADRKPLQGAAFFRSEVMARLSALKLIDVAKAA